MFTCHAIYNFCYFVPSSFDSPYWLGNTAGFMYSLSNLSLYLRAT